ncbi:MAG: Bug family tripartite tricarboxylate transporter substrate binding protein, partial [Beijerinckiaceae bacterium]
MTIDRRHFTLATAATLAMPAISRAQGFPSPSKQVKVIVPFPAGGSTDIVGRAVAEEYGKLWNTQVIVENKPGAGANVGIEHVARSDPDGHTILISPIGMTINPHLYKTLNYKLEDFAPVGLVIELPNLMTVPNSSPAKTVQEFIAHAKANPGKLTFASSGVGTSIHLSGELFKRLAGVEMTHVPYRGSSMAINDLMSGRVDVMFDNITFMLPQVQGGQVRGLGVTTKDRAKSAPDLPTLQEAGVAGFDVSSWFGVVAPAKTPADVLSRLS